MQRRQDERTGARVKSPGLDEVIARAKEYFEANSVVRLCRYPIFQQDLCMSFILADALSKP